MDVKHVPLFPIEPDHVAVSSGSSGMIGGKCSASYSILKLPLDFCMHFVVMPRNI